MGIPTKGTYSKKTLFFWFVLTTAWTRILYRFLIEPARFEPQHLVWAAWILPLGGVGLLAWIVMFFREVSRNGAGGSSD